MALADETLKTTHTVTYFVRIYTTPGTYSGANVLLQASDPNSATGVPGIEGIRISKSFDSPVPVCQLDLSRVPTWITRGQGVTVDVGYNGLTQRLFTGFIQSRERGVGKGSIQCMGRLWTAFRTVQIGERSVDGDTVEQAIEDILDYVGLTDNRSLTIPAFTLGTASDPVLERMPASQMLQMLMDIDGCRIYELGSGQIVIRVIDEAPAPVAYKTYTTNANATARILEASDREDPEYYRNRVIVTGTTVIEGSAPDETSRTITATATNTGSALVQPALPSGTYIDAEYNNHLIDTDAKAADVAIRLLAKFARIPRQLQIELAGDPELELGQTIAFVMPEIDLNDRGFISGIEHVIDGNGYRTRLTDFRGAGDTGGTLSQNPIAAFTFKSEIEVFGATTNVFAALDASNSFDPDGTIASYAWSDNQTTTPEIATLTTQQVLVRGDTSAWTGSWEVTLTVTDNDGLTGSTTITIPYTNTDAEIVLPAIYAAINNRHSASLDGAINWNDSTVGSGNSISVGARPSDGVNVGHAIYGTSTGRIYRTTDAGVTVTLVYTSAAAVAMNDVRWDWRNGNVCWAIDENAIVYISLDAGVTWTIYSSLRTTLSLAGALGNQLGLPAAGGVYVFGGTGAGSPLIAYDPVVGSQAWTRPTLTGDIATDTITTPGDATLRIVDYTAGYTKECLILSWSSGGGASITAVYSATSPPFANSWAFTRASTTFGGLKTGRYIVSDNVLIKSDYFIAAFANRAVWESTDGVAWTEIADVMPSGVTPWHCIGMTGSTELTGIVGMFGVFMIAASDGIYKYTPRIDATASYVRGGDGAGTAWPASAIGKKLSIGAPGLASTPFQLYAQMDAGDEELLACDGATWAEMSTDADNNNWHLKNLNGVLYRIADKLVTTDIGGVGDLERSTDNGASWTIEIAKDADAGIQSVTISADGTLWALWGSHTAPATDFLKVYKSVDDGETWTLEYTDADVSGLAPVDIACHPTNASIIAITCIRSSGGARLLYSATTGVSFTLRTITVTGSGLSGLWLTFSQAGRIVVAGGGSIIQTSDDLGVTWTTRDNPSGTASMFIFRVGSRLLYGVSTASSDGGSIRISTDEGTTWASYITGVALDSALTSGAVQAACMDQNGGLCVAFSSATLTDAWWRTSDPWGTPIWTSIAFNADALATSFMSLQGLAAGPSE
ncbi:MAG: glycoside hydrolase [Acidobacteriota bacterium]|nr:glycoside hydrolase [Acidobacteriota bacterium]